MKTKRKTIRYYVVAKGGRILHSTCSEHVAFGFAQACRRNVRILGLKQLWAFDAKGVAR